MTGIVPLGLTKLLSSSRCIVDIQLHECPGIGFFSPKSLLNALSELTKLQSLPLELLPNAAHIAVPHPSVVLPTLTSLKYQGTNEWLKDILAILHTPRLANVEITFFNEPILDLPESWMEMQMSYRRSEILFSEDSISIFLTRPASTFKFQVFFQPNDLRHSSLVDFCTRYSAFLSSVEDLRICVTPTSSWQNDSDREEWLEVIRAFGGTKWFHLDGNSGSTTEIALALQSSETVTVLPALHKLCIREPVSRFASLREAVVSFMQSRMLSFHFIGVKYERRQRQFIYRLDGIGTTFI